MVDERTVDVHISWLRGKLESAGLSGDFIKTVYGQAIDLPYHWMAPIPKAPALASLPTLRVTGLGGQVQHPAGHGGRCQFEVLTRGRRSRADG